MRLSVFAFVAIMLPCVHSTANAHQSKDLALLSPQSKDVCSVIDMLRRSDQGAAIISNAVLLSGLPSRSDPRSLMTKGAWAEANSITYKMSDNSGFSVQRLPIGGTKAAGWVFSVLVGSLNNSLLWVVTSTPDGKRAAHLVVQIGQEGSGPFNTYFITYQALTYAITRSFGDKGSYWVVYGLEPGKALCSFAPM